MIGQTLSHFRITAKLGEGGMGEVYRAEDTTLKREVALKILPPELAGSQERLERFQREAESLAALNHPNIVHVYTVETDQEVHFLTMELVEGERLDRLTPRNGLALEQFFDLALSLADALAEAHEHGIVHRDLKPSNIMVDAKGRPKILDFGLAKLRQPEEPREDLSQLPTEAMTQEGHVLGTYPYMSPEQVEGKSVDHRSDLFSLGIVLYEMAVGQRPFKGDSPVSVMAAILKETPLPIHNIKPALSEGLQALLDTCLEKDVESRIQSAAELHDRLAALAPGALRHPIASSAQPSDIFISYARKDRPAAEALAHHLERHGWSVWWDREIAAGETFDEVIEEAVRATRCVTVLWSKHSVGSRWVRAEAEEGAKRHILVPVLLDEAEIPLAFRQIQAADLTAWEGSEENLAGGELIRDIQRILEPTDDQLQPRPRGSADHPLPPLAPGKEPAKAIRKPLLAALGVLALIALVLTLLKYGPWRGTDESTATTSPLITSLAVLPLQNLSGDSEQAYYAAGITEGLITDLGRIGALRVISKQSVMRFKASEKSLPEIAAELGVEALIEGSVLAVGERVRVTAQLIQATPEQQLWAETYERDAKDILALLREVTRAITTEVQATVSPLEEAKLAEVVEVDPEAHRAYLKGMYFLDQFGSDTAMKAKEYFQQSIEIDPTYAPAWAGLAANYTNMELWLLPWDEDIRVEAAVQSEVALQRALELDDSLSTGHSLRARIEALRNWNWDRAEAEHRRAIQLSPNDSAAHVWYAHFLSAMGRHDEAKREAEIAETLDPLSPLVPQVVGGIHRNAREFDIAIEYFENAWELTPENPWIPAEILLTYGAAKRSEEYARTAMGFRTLLAETDPDPERRERHQWLADNFAGATLVEVNELYIGEVLDPSSPLYKEAGPMWVAICYAMNGDERALEFLEKTYALREPGDQVRAHLMNLKVDPVWDGLRSEPRFQDLLRRMNLAD